MQIYPESTPDDWLTLEMSRTGFSHLKLFYAVLICSQSFREVGLYWAGSIGHSMIVFIPGNIVGKSSLYYYIIKYWYQPVIARS